MQIAEKNVGTHPVVSGCHAPSTHSAGQGSIPVGNQVKGCGQVVKGKVRAGNEPEDDRPTCLIADARDDADHLAQSKFATAVKYVGPDICV